ncbi:hypothetical protein [Novosphingobium sp.]|uniref:hypothetical protein n=1 Tax=Novosphingobium sp. TaxID=1874826 RepID=UPI00260D72EC|nr:hypothetical protein [Novosphingobium sp.]
MARTHHILNAASNLLGISLLLIAGLRISDSGGKTMADEIAWMSAAGFSISCFFSYLALREGPRAEVYEAVADRSFLVGLATLVVAVGVLGMATSLR